MYFMSNVLHVRFQDLVKFMHYMLTLLRVQHLSLNITKKQPTKYYF